MAGAAAKEAQLAPTTAPGAATELTLHTAVPDLNDRRVAHVPHPQHTEPPPENRTCLPHPSQNCPHASATGKPGARSCTVQWAAGGAYGDTLSRALR